MASLAEGFDQYTPSVVKSCARCRTRKVKCDLKIPQCTACTRHGEACNITDYVAYPYSTVEKLHARVQELEQRLLGLKSTSQGHGTVEPLQTSHPAGQQSTMDRLLWSADVTKEAEEVGVLAIGFQDPYSHTKYVGAAAGSTFSRIFFKQIGLDGTANSESRYPVHNTDAQFLTSKAALPQQNIALNYISVYIARVHMQWPFLYLPNIRSCFRRIYQSPRECTDHEKFIVFMIMALASQEAQLEHEKHRSTTTVDLNNPEDYFQTAIHFFSRFHAEPRDFQALQGSVLLTIWMLHSQSCNDSNDLWQITRYTMSVAIELGIHRHNPSWSFTLEELEIRRRTWWTIYSLERFVALNTGRVLSMRDQAIDTPLPSHSPIDNLSAQETQVASLFQSKSIWLFVHLIELRRMSGRILESIYIARAQNGHCSSMSFRELCTISDELHRKLEKWKVELDSAGLEGSREYRFMKVEYFIMLLHLNRPSPSFMIPSQNMVAICSHASSSCLREWEAIAADHGIMAICRCYRQFHDILMVGLARLYCDWHIQKVAPHSVHNLSSEEATLCINLLEQGVVTLRNSSLSKFLHLFNILKSKIYSITNTAMDVDMHPTGLGDTIGTADWPSEDIQAHASNPQAGLTTHLASLDNNDAGDLRLGSDGLNAYLSQISNIFDNETLDSDEMLTAWYGSLLNDIGDSGAQPTTGL